MKFSSGAYRHCRPCTAAAVRGGVVEEDNHILYEYDDEKSSILVGSSSERQAMSDHVHHNGMLNEDDCGMAPQFGDSLPPSSRYDLLPISHSKRQHRHKKKTTSTSSASSSRSTLTLKQLPSNPDSCDAIEQLLNAHFLREERILAEEQTCVRRDDEQLLGEESGADHQLLEEEAQLVCREQRMEEHIEADNDDDGDVHVNRGKRHAKVDSAGKFEEWVAQVEPGVMITFVALHDGSNHLKRIRFSREMFSKWQAQLWWAENSDMVRELYSVSKSAAPFKSCASARSSSSCTSSSTTTSSLHHHALRNTPEVQSRVGSSQSSPSQTPLVINTMENKTYSHESHPQPSSSCIPHFPISHSLRGLSHEIVDHHDNPLYDGPEFELCYHEGVKDSLILQRDLWAEGHSQRLQEARDDVIDGDDPNATAGGLVRELKRVRFIRQLPQSSN